MGPRECDTTEVVRATPKLRSFDNLVPENASVVSKFWTAVLPVPVTGMSTLRKCQSVAPVSVMTMSRASFPRAAVPQAWIASPGVPENLAPRFLFGSQSLPPELFSVLSSQALPFQIDGIESVRLHGGPHSSNSKLGSGEVSA